MVYGCDCTRLFSCLELFQYICVPDFLLFRLCFGQSLFGIPDPRRPEQYWPKISKTCNIQGRRNGPGGPLLLGGGSFGGIFRARLRYCLALKNRFRGILGSRFFGVFRVAVFFLEFFNPLFADILDGLPYFGFFLGFSLL